MPPVTAVELRGIFPTQADDTALATFLQTATVLMGSLASCFAAASPPLTADEIHELTLYFAAHIMVATAPAGSLESFGITSELREVYTGKFGIALQATRYGQIALLLDRSGCLKALDNQAQGKLAAQLRLVHQRTDPLEPLD